VIKDDPETELLPLWHLFKQNRQEEGKQRSRN